MDNNERLPWDEEDCDEEECEDFDDPWDDWDPVDTCDECRGLGDDYVVEDGELVCWCDRCGVGKDRVEE